ncbi:helix-turn-helix transcriptional regulator [Rhizobium sp. ARZ01]|nr:helix-turn-helix transcriptional regulator [Rhizobium sp. ARZ01]
MRFGGKGMRVIRLRRGRDVSPEQIAATIGLSPRQFTRLFQAHIGMTPKHFILETRLRYVRFLLDNSVLSVTAIAHETGFSGSAHLATAFRKKCQNPERIPA